MSQPSLARAESNGTWLPLIEYSVRSGLSLSTIRRKIKSHTLTYRMENGRYLILFEGMNSGARSMSGPILPMLNVVKSLPKEAPLEAEEFDAAVVENTKKGKPMETQSVGSSFVDGTVKMVSEAFECALREKDERIHLLEKSNRSLEERLNELRLLVKVLEEKYEVRY